MKTFNQSQIIRYALYGILLGLLFPVAATVIAWHLDAGPLTVARIVHIQSSNPLLWVIDSAPFLLGLLAGMVGHRQDRIQTLLHSLGGLVEDRTAELQQSRNRLENIIQSMADLMLVLNNHGVIEDANIATLNTFGYEASELVGQSVTVILGHDVLEKIRLDSVGDLFEDGFLRMIEGVYPTRSGRTVYLRISVSYLWDENGQSRGILCVGKDITNIRESEIRFKSIFLNASDAIICADSEGIMNLWNNAATRIFGYAETEVLGKNINLLIPDRFKESHQNGFSRFRQTGQRKITQPVELYGIHKDGHELAIELTLAHWTATDNIHITSIIRDITPGNNWKSRCSGPEKITSPCLTVPRYPSLWSMTTGSCFTMQKQRPCLDTGRMSWKVPLLPISSTRMTWQGFCRISVNSPRGTFRPVFSPSG